MRYDEIDPYYRNGDILFERFKTDPLVLFERNERILSILHYDQFRTLLDLAGEMTAPWHIHDIVVPVPGSHLDEVVRPSAAIVAQDMPDGRLCRHEGRLHEREKHHGHYGKLFNAASSLPRISFIRRTMPLQPNEAVVVGRYDECRWTVSEILDGAKLEAWAGETMDEIFGIWLPEGPTRDLTGVKHLDRLFLGPCGNFFKTKTGQVIVESANAYGTEELIVFNHDNPELLPYLADLDWHELKMVLGPQLAARELIRRGDWR